MRIWKTLREVEWFAIIALLLLVFAVVLAVWFPELWALAIVLSVSAVVSSIFGLTRG